MVRSRNIIALGAGLVLAATTGLHAAPSLSRSFKNVIVMIPDGCGISHFTIARWYKQEPLAVDALHVAQVRTYGSNSLITDSAPAATAFASGYKTHDKYIGILPPSYALAIPTGLNDGFSIPSGWENRPVASVLEGARLKGMATGVIATSTTSHATPAAYTSHWYARSNEAIITEQQVYAGLNVLFGGGRRHITAATRPDSESLTDSLASWGYRVITDKTQLAALPDTASRVWGQFNSSAMGPDYDRKLSAYAEEPSLAEMTDKAIKMLSGNAAGNANGFFLLVEGSQVDWASHANDPVGVMSEYMAFDAAVQIAVDFAQTSSTLVLVVSDHDNGGMSLGNFRSDATYSSLPMDSVFNQNVLMRADLTGIGIALELGASPSDASVISVMNAHYGINDLTQGEIDTIKANANVSDLQYVIGPMISKRAMIGWTTTGHTGSDVPLYYYGTDDHFGTMENTDVARLCAQAMSLDMAKVNDTLFVDASVLFAGATSMTIDTVGVNNSRGSLTVVDGDRTGVFPFNKSEAIVNGTKYPMIGLTVYSYRNGTVYLPKQAKDILSGTVQSIPDGLLKVGRKTATVEIFTLSGRRVRQVRVQEGLLNLQSLKLPEGSYAIRVDHRPSGTVLHSGTAFFEVRTR